MKLFGVALKQKGRSRSSKAAIARALGPLPFACGSTLHARQHLLAEAASSRKPPGKMRAAIALNRDYGEAWFILGTALKQQGDFAGAEAALHTAIRFAPG